jgi:hypothetical protein
VTPRKELLHQHKATKEVKRIFRQIHEKAARYELNLYVIGYEDEEAGEAHAEAAGSHLPEERSPNV